MQGDKFDRRYFLKAGGVSALGTQMALAGSPAPAQESAPSTRPHEKGFPQLAIITRYSPQKLAFAASTEYQGVVITVDRNFNPKLSDSQIDQILTSARQANLPIITIECMNPNHIASDPAKRREAIADFIQHLELGHRLGCKSVGTFSGGMAGVSMEDQAKAFAEVFNGTTCRSATNWTSAWDGKTILAIPTLQRFLVHGRRYLISFPAIVSASNSILRIWCGSTSTISKRLGISRKGSCLYTRSIPRSSSRFCKRWEFMVRAGAVTASPARD